MPPKRQPKVLLFDLGGVVVRWVGIEALAKLTHSSPQTVKSILGQSKIFHQFERGYGSSQMFLRTLIREFELDVSETEMLTMWNDWVEEPYEGIEDKLLKLKSNFTTACLSNTNSLHWKHLNAYLLCENLLHHVYASHQIHQAKPDQSCYEFVCKDMGVAPSDIWFFDDTNENVLAAQKHGMTALKVDPQKGVIPLLEKFGLT